MRAHNYLYLKCVIAQAIIITPVAPFSNIAGSVIIRTNSNHNTVITSFPRKRNRIPNYGLLASHDKNSNDGNGFDNQKSSSTANNNKKDEKKKNTAQFEIQELRGQLTAISKARIPPRNLTPEKRTELAAYLRTVLEKCPSPISLRSIGDNGASALHGSWRLGFTSAFGIDGDGDGKDSTSFQQDLPKEAEVFLKFYPDYKCDYILSFSKRVLFLEKIISKSSYIVDCSPVNPGLVTIIYQNIVTDVMGMKDLKVGLFGMLKGRVTYVDTVWFDGDIWVERSYSQDGTEVFNIYVKDDNDDIWGGGGDL